MTLGKVMIPCFLFLLVFWSFEQEQCKRPSGLVALLSEVTGNLNLKWSRQCWLESWDVCGRGWWSLEFVLLLGPHPPWPLIRRKRWPLGLIQCEILWCEDFVIGRWHLGNPSPDLWTNERPGSCITYITREGRTSDLGWSSQISPVNLKEEQARKYEWLMQPVSATLKMAQEQPFSRLFWIREGQQVSNLTPAQKPSGRLAKGGVFHFEKIRVGTRSFMCSFTQMNWLPMN